MEGIGAKYQDLALKHLEEILMVAAEDAPILLKEYAAKTPTKWDDMIIAQFEGALAQILKDLAGKVHKG